jgi:lipid-A-disaccharide synthase
MPSCLIVAGEKSGEEHAMTFFAELRNLNPSVNFFGVAGDDLSQDGVELLYHLKDFSSMGFSEVVGKIPFYFNALKRIEEEVVSRKTKVAILIDFQDFNLRLAERLSKHGVKVLYYVAPQAWVWKPWRAEALAKCVHTLFTILPFEKKWFQDRGVHQIKSIPHPLINRFQDDFKKIPERPHGSWGNKIKILLLPGSRSFEVRELLPRFIEAIDVLKKNYQIETHLVKVDHLSSNLYEYFESKVDVIYDSTEIHEAMKICHFSFAASGTVTLATGVYELPTIVCYRASLLNEFIYNNFISYKGPISLTNIIHQKYVFPEIVQNEVTSQRLARILRTWIENEVEYNEIKETLKNTKSILSGEDFSVPQYMSRVLNE